MGTSPLLTTEAGIQTDTVPAGSPLGETPSFGTTIAGIDCWGVYHGLAGNAQWPVQLENPFYSENPMPDSQMPRYEPSTTAFLRHAADVGHGLQDPSLPSAQTAQFQHPLHSTSGPFGLPRMHSTLCGFPHGDPQSTGQWPLRSGIPSERFGCTINPLSYPNLLLNPPSSFLGFPSFKQGHMTKDFSSGDSLRPFPQNPSAIYRDGQNLPTPTMMPR